MERLSTPADRFVGLPGFPFTQHHTTVTDPTGGAPLTMGYLDEGPRDARETILLLHGEPTWSYLYRKVIPPLVEVGHRVIAPDLIGFGRSDKPTDRAEYTYARHVEWVREALFDRLNLSNLTYFGQDWGALVGLRVLAENPDRFVRCAIGNGGLPTGEERTSDAFLAWQEYSQTVEDLRVGRIVFGGCLHKPSDEVVAAYDAPFPTDAHKAGARVFPTLVPTSPSDPAHSANVAAWRVLREWKKPFLTCFSDSDPITKGADQKFQREILGAAGQAHVTITSAAHFLQEDQGEELAQVLHQFIVKN